MRILFVWMLGVLLVITTPLQAQLEIIACRYTPDVWQAEQGTRGLDIQLEYKYNGKGVLPTVNRLGLIYNNQSVYSDSTTVLVLIPSGTQQTAHFFIPYRQIELEEGDYDMVILQYQCLGQANWSEVLSFRQPARLSVEITLSSASVKRQMEYWDTGTNPYHWAPDPYWYITTNSGTMPIASAPDTLNSYDLSPRQMQFAILEGDRLWWHWYDEDGAVDDSLGTYALPVASGDFKQRQEGMMFGSIKGLTFTYAQKILRTQPITLRVQPDFVHQGRKGVRVEAEYHLARAYRGERANFSFWLENTRGDTSGVRWAQPLDGSPALGTTIDLSKNTGKLAYFIPFYHWDNDTRYLRFAFKTQKGQQTVSAPYVFHQPVHFERFVLYSGYDIEEQYKYKGVSGIRLRLYYRVRDIHRYSPLQVAFSAAAACDIYALQPKSHILLTQKKAELRQPKETDTLYFFIPYFSLKANQLAIKMEMIPDGRLSILNTQTVLWNIPKDTRDVVLELQSADNLCWNGDYGHVVAMRYKVPELLLPHATVQLSAWQNGNKIEHYVLSASGLDSLRCPVRDTGVLRIVFPFRRLQAKDSLRVLATVIEKQTGRPISPPLQHRTFAPSELHNLSMSFDLKTLAWDKSTSVTEDSVDFPFEYLLKVGSETKIRQILYPAWDKNRRDQLNRPLWLHREDKIEIVIQHRRPKGERWVLWQGDVGKFQQFDYTTTWTDPDGLLKKAVLKAKRE